ncbi:hypothetical protein, partial [Phormidium nigroviride]
AKQSEVRSKPEAISTTYYTFTIRKSCNCQLGKNLPDIPISSLPSSLFLLPSSFFLLPSSFFLLPSSFLL